jgi:hypothetical protein
VETPSAQRLGTIPRFDFSQNPVRPPEEYFDKRDADKKQRHSVEHQDADGWTESKGILPTDMRWEYNPRLKPPPEPRKTSVMAPTTYSFTRPFMDGFARTFNGTHFSMADHRRNYEILGMAPTRTPRNTYRIEPTPWDVDIVDLPPSYEPDAVQARLRGVEVPGSGRAMRL